MATRKKSKKTSKAISRAKWAYGRTKEFMTKHQVASRGKSFLVREWPIPTWALLIVGGVLVYKTYKASKAPEAVNGLLGY